MSKEQLFYKKYTELLEDDSFLQWRILPSEQTNTYWYDLQLKYPLLKNEIEQADDYLKTYLADKQELTLLERKTLLEKIIRSVHQGEKKPPNTPRIWYWVISAAACAAILLGVFLFKESPLPAEGEDVIVGNRLNDKDIQLITGDKIAVFEQNIDITVDSAGVVTVATAGENEEKINITFDVLSKLIVPYGKRSQITLADGSKVWLNSGSSLEFPAAFKNESRSVTLSGEMYIEVAASTKPFIVNTAAFNVKVYGTKFNVSVYENSHEQSVVLVEGSVGVAMASGEEATLLPNYMFKLNGNNFELVRVNSNEYISWKDGYLIFNNAPISEVLKQLGRYYNIYFNTENNVNLQQRRCKGKVFLSDNIDDTMLTISLLSGTEYTREGNVIHIRKK